MPDQSFTFIADEVIEAAAIICLESMVLDQSANEVLAFLVQY
jgi:hypothetical protein